MYTFSGLIFFSLFEHMLEVTLVFYAKSITMRMGRWGEITCCLLQCTPVTLSWPLVLQTHQNIELCSNNVCIVHRDSRHKNGFCEKIRIPNANLGSHIVLLSSWSDYQWSKMKVTHRKWTSKETEVPTGSRSWHRTESTHWHFSLCFAPREGSQSAFADSTGTTHKTESTNPRIKQHCSFWWREPPAAPSQPALPEVPPHTSAGSPGTSPPHNWASSPGCAGLGHSAAAPAPTGTLPTTSVGTGSGLGML